MLKLKAKKFIRIFLDYIKTRKLILFITFLYTVIVLVVLLNRFWQYEVFYYDHGMTEGTAYQISQFKIPLHHREFGKVIIYVDHLYPTLQLTLTPFYWLWNSYETPIVVFSVLIGLSVLIGFEIANKLIKNKVIIYALLFSFMFYIGMQNAIIFFIHDTTFSIPFTMLLFLSLVYNKKKLFFIFLLLVLGCKESMSVTMFALGISLLLFFKKSWRKEAVLTLIISLIYGFLSAKIIIPYFRNLVFGQPAFSNEPDFNAPLLDYFTRFFDMPQKRETIFVSLATFGFLPLLSLFAYPLLIQDFAQRFVLLSPHFFRQGLNLHYNASLAVLLFVGSVFAVSFLQRKKWYQKIITWHAVLIIVTTIIYHRLIYHGPLGLIYNKDFFKITKNMKFMDEFVAKIPLQGKIMLQNNLAVRFTHEDLYILTSEDQFKKVSPNVIAFDYRPGQNPNNFWPMNEEEMNKLANKLLQEKKYQLIFQSPYRYIFQKNEP